MKSNAETILEAIEDLHNQEQIVTRETLSQLTELKLSVIHDHLSYLVDSSQQSDYTCTACCIHSDI